MRAAVLLLVMVLVSSAFAQRIPFNSTWTLFRYGQTGQEASVSTLNPPFLRFDVGRVLGWTGCSSFSSGVLGRGADLRIGAPEVTRGPCSSDAARALERYVLQSLPQVKRFYISGDFLVLFTSDRETLVFKRGE